MTLKVLQNKTQIRRARDTLQARGLSSVPGPIKRTIAKAVSRAGLAQPLVLGDFVKSWDLLTSIEFLEANVPPDGAVLDIGAYASEILVALKKAGYTDLTGVDLNSRLKDMPFQQEIKYVTSDFMSTPFADSTFAAVTSISVIEHGFNPEKMMKEMARILRPGGFFIASFDYWREKITTGNTRFFDMDWLIFSEQDVNAMIAVAAEHGLMPVGDLYPQTGERAIEHGGFHYTFGWLVLQRRP